MLLQQSQLFDTVISLGSECQARYNISRTLWFRRYQTFDGFFLANDCSSGGDWGTFLFDWSYAPDLKPLIKLLQHDLNGSFSAGVTLKTRHDGSQTVIDCFSGLQYPHQFSGTPEGTASIASVDAELALTQEKFDYLAEKTRNLLAGDGAVLLVYCGNATDTELSELLSLLKQRVKNFLLLYVPWAEADAAASHQLQDEHLLIRPCRFKPYPGDLNAWSNIFADVDFVVPEATQHVKRFNAPSKQGAKEKKAQHNTSVSISSLYWHNTAALYPYHKKVMDYLDIPVNYYHLDSMDHGQFITDILATHQHDVIGFLDIDCIPKNRAIVEKAIEWVIKHDSFIGLAQVSNHIKPATHVFAAPSFFFITRSCYEALGKPSCLANGRSDVIEELSHIADEKGISYKCLYPLYYEKNPSEGRWRLSNYGYFGIGCHYAGGIYNLYQSRLELNTALFKTQCDKVLAPNTTVNHDADAVIFCAEPLVSHASAALSADLYQHALARIDSEPMLPLSFQSSADHWAVTITLLTPQHPDHLENFADNIGLNTFEVGRRQLRVKCHIVSVFVHAPLQRFWLMVGEVSIPLTAKPVNSPFVGQKYDAISWAGRSRFIINDVVVLPDTIASAFTFDLMTEVSGVAQKIGMIQLAAQHTPELSHSILTASRR